MKLIIAGSRHLNLDYNAIQDYIDHFGLNTLAFDGKISIVSGTAKGIDIAGEQWADMCNLSVHRFPADWDNEGKKAGHLRNKKMAKYADALLLIWDGKSKGSGNMKMNMEKLNKPIYEIILNEK